MSRVRTATGWDDEGRRPPQPDGVGWPLGLWSGLVDGVVMAQALAQSEGGHTTRATPVNVNWFKQYHRVRR